jgi:hypothetical protein
LESDNITNTYYFTDIRDRRIEEIEEDAVWSEDPDNDNDLNILKQIPYNMFSFVS